LIPYEREKKEISFGYSTVPLKLAHRSYSYRDVWGA